MCVRAIEEQASAECNSYCAADKYKYVPVIDTTETSAPCVDANPDVSLVPSSHKSRRAAADRATFGQTRAEQDAEREEFRA